MFVPFACEWGMSLEAKSALTMSSILLLLLCATVNVLSSPAITLTQCKSGDNTCVIKVIQAAFPVILEPNAEIGAEELDPLYQEVIEGNLSILKFKLFNTTTTGFKSCEIKNAKYDDAPETLQVELICSGFKLKGQYDINGRLIVLPVQGIGDYTLDTNKYQLIVDLDLKTTTKDGKTYKTIKNFKVKAVPLERVNFNFRNLFNGQKELAESVLKFANENWKDVAHEVQDPVFRANFKKVVKNANKYLKTIPIDEYTAA